VSSTLHFTARVARDVLATSAYGRTFGPLSSVALEPHSTTGKAGEESYGP